MPSLRLDVIGNGPQLALLSRRWHQGETASTGVSEILDVALAEVGGHKQGGSKICKPLVGPPEGRECEFLALLPHAGGCHGDQEKVPKDPSPIFFVCC
jgi:hypothetical protein